MIEDNTLRAAYVNALQAAEAAVVRGDKQFAMQHLKAAMAVANKLADKQFARAVFRAMSFARRIQPAAI